MFSWSVFWLTVIEIFFKICYTFSFYFNNWSSSKFTNNFFFPPYAIIGLHCYKPLTLWKDKDAKCLTIQRRVSVFDEHERKTLAFTFILVQTQKHYFYFYLKRKCIEWTILNFFSWFANVTLWWAKKIFKNIAFDWLQWKNCANNRHFLLLWYVWW